MEFIEYKKVESDWLTYIIFMATKKFSETSSPDLMSQFECVTALIHQTYDPLIEKLKARRDVLLEEVALKRDEYYSREIERKRAVWDSDKLEKGLNEPVIDSDLLVPIRARASLILEQELGELRVPTKPSVLLFQCPTLTCVQEQINNLGRIVEVPKYIDKGTPFVRAGKKGNGLGEFEEPRGLTIDEVNKRVYIADSGNHRIQIFNFEGDFISEFGHQHLKKPYGIDVTEKYIYITDTSQQILFQFAKDSLQFRKRSGGDGKKVDLKSPQGLCVNEIGEVFIADTLNHRIAVLTRGLQFMCSIGNGKLQYPRDVKLREDSVVVLDDSPKCVHFFSKNGDFKRSCVTQGTDVDKSVRAPKFFCLDITGNLIFSDWGNHRVTILTSFGKSLQAIGHKGETEGQMVYPSGIAISENGIIFVVSHNRNYAIQCF